MIIADLTTTLKILDLTTEPYSGASQVGTILNPGGDTNPLRCIAAASMYNNVFAVGESGPGTDVFKTILNGVTPTYGHHFGGCCT